MGSYSPALSTLDKAQEYRKIFKELEQVIKAIDIRTYIYSQTPQAKEQNIQFDLILDDETKQKLEELSILRKNIIVKEMKYVLAQIEVKKQIISKMSKEEQKIEKTSLEEIFKENNTTLEELLSGNYIGLKLSDNLLNEFPGLGIYNFFPVYSTNELENFLSNNQENNIGNDR